MTGPQCTSPSKLVLVVVITVNLFDQLNNTEVHRAVPISTERYIPALSIFPLVESACQLDGELRGHAEK